MSGLAWRLQFIRRSRNSSRNPLSATNMSVFLLCSSPSLLLSEAYFLFATAHPYVKLVQAHKSYFITFILQLKDQTCYFTLLPLELLLGQTQLQLYLKARQEDSQALLSSKTWAKWQGLILHVRYTSSLWGRTSLWTVSVGPQSRAPQLAVRFPAVCKV